MFYSWGLQSLIVQTNLIFHLQHDDLDTMAQLRRTSDNLSLGSFGRTYRAGLGMLTSSSQGSIGSSDIPHASSLLSNMEELRQNGKLCDVFLEAEDQTLSAHRVVLSACSPYFCAMFTNDMKESSEVVQ